MCAEQGLLYDIILCWRYDVHYLLSSGRKVYDV